METQTPAPPPALATIGSDLMEFFAGLGRFTRFMFQVLYRAVTPRFFPLEIVDYLALVMFRCLLPVVLTIAPSGLVLALQGTTIFNMFGAERLLSYLVGLSVYREMGPVLTGVLLAAQGGASFAAELGAMRVQEQIDATEVMAVDPLRIHVVPRVIALTLSAPALYLLGSAAGVFAGFLGSVLLYGQDPAAFVDTLFNTVTFYDVATGAAKSTVFGLDIALISCFQGYSVKGGANEVGLAVNDTVVYSVVTFLGLNYLMTSAWYGVVG